MSIAAYTKTFAQLTGGTWESGIGLIQGTTTGSYNSGGTIYFFNKSFAASYSLPTQYFIILAIDWIALLIHYSSIMLELPRWCRLVAPRALLALSPPLLSAEHRRVLTPGLCGVVARVLQTRVV